MTCSECGGEMTVRRENYRYDACGLPNITLQKVEVGRCPKCGETEVAIPSLEGLHRSLAQAIIRKPSRLVPAEIRFLRKYLGWSGADFAARMGTAAETVSRWETGAAPMGPTADRLLRLMVATTAPKGDYSLDVLATIGRDTTPRPMRLSFATDRLAGWRLETVAA